MFLVIERLADAMVRETPLPYLYPRTRFLHKSVRIATLDELHGALKSEGWLGSEQEMDVVRHQNKFVKLKDSAVVISEKGFDKKCCCRFRPEERPSFPNHRSYEKRTICKAVHFTAAESRFLLGPLFARLKPCASTVRLTV